MRLRPVAIVRLKSTFRHASSSIQYKRPGKPLANREKREGGRSWRLPGLRRVCHICPMVC
jgi:hypothetical protein